jgi:hypothetical protein
MIAGGMWYDAANPKHAAATDLGKLTNFPENSLDDRDLTVMAGEDPVRVKWRTCFRQQNNPVL